jgi:methylated-DNA-[protein]-cysteine S-methyltransferase
MTRHPTVTGRTHVAVSSPIGPLTLVADHAELTGLYFGEHPPDPASLGTPGDAAAEPFTSAASQLAAYFEGRLTAFDLPLAPSGTQFQLRVWAALQSIPYGQTMSYGQLASKIGSPAASRAVGLANGKNPIALIVPCHRVIGADGSLTGYGGGLDRKRFLLDLERGFAAM